MIVKDYNSDLGRCFASIGQSPKVLLLASRALRKYT